MKVLKAVGPSLMLPFTPRKRMKSPAMRSTSRRWWNCLAYLG